MNEVHGYEFDMGEPLVTDSPGEFATLFPGCELGAMPPFGNLYGLETYVTQSLADDEEIAFNAGTLTELVRMPYRDFERVVHPKPIPRADMR